MGKIFDNINSMIMSAMKSKQAVETNAYKNLKAKMLEFKTAANAKPLDDAAEISIINKMVKELRDDAELFKNNNRIDLAEPALAEANVLNVLAPAAVSEDDIRKVINNYIAENGQFEQKTMGKVMQYIKSNLINTDMGTASKIVKTYF